VSLACACRDCATVNCSCTVVFLSSYRGAWFCWNHLLSDDERAEARLAGGLLGQAADAESAKPEGKP